MTTYIFIIAIFILFSAYFSATETAFSSLNKTRIKALAEKGDKRAQLTCKLAGDYDKLLSTILIGNNIVNIGASSLGTILFIELLGNADTGATVSTVVITIVVLIFGEITPKSVAKDMPEKFAMFSAPFLNVLMTLMTPLTAVFSGWKKLVSKVFKTQSDGKMSQEELLLLVDEVQQEGSIDQNEGELLRNAIEFAEQEAQDILTHRVDLEAVPLDATKEQIAGVFSESKFSRILVYRESIDDIVGVIHQKDFYTGTGITEKAVTDIVSPIIFVLQNEKISPLLRKLQKNKSHIAVVLDEYGGTCGIVTMEDILEELVGDIYDEHDDVVEEFSRVGDNAYQVDCSMELDEFCDHFGLKTDSEMASLSGWVAEQLEKIPEVGDSFTFQDLTVTVTAVDGHRADRVDILRQPQVQEEEKESRKSVFRS